jgi:isoleucyl-tRNA synthetase
MPQKDYKDTLNLPRTDFPMKANLTQKEPQLLRFWEDARIYEKLQQKNNGNRTYILHDGPPYANGHIHIGHALNKILKDIIVKYKSMQGFHSPYVPGWDCHGLPIELQVDKNLGDEKERIGILEKRNLCREYASRYIDVQREEFKRLGVFGDWFSPYLTMTYSYESAIVAEFVKFVKKGHVYKGKKPVHWCPSCVTALAEAEVEYSDRESPSIYVRFRVPEHDIEEKLPALKGKNVYIIIWTTTPWTLPANLALAVHPELEYSAVQSDGDVLIMASELREQLASEGKVLLTVKGSELEGIQAEHPFIGRSSRVILCDFVSATEGTGIVHIAPGHGEDDYEAGIRYGIDIYAPVDDYGRFTHEVKELENQPVFKANALIIDMLRERNALIREGKLTHSYPHCWRCKKPVIFRATEQWFISMQMEDLRNRCLLEIERVKWIPAWGRERIYGMVSSRPDWCISRQRAWGVPITLFTCEGCGEFVREPEILDETVRLIEHNGSDAWFVSKSEEVIPSEYKCRKCGSSSFKKEIDILDVWFESGVSHAAVLEKDRRLSWPADIYLEGSDQHRGWFQSSLISSVGTRNSAPYGTVLTHGFVVDGQGKKMSKSLGNVVSPQDVIKRHGAEILRLWVSAEDYRDDIRISKEIIDRLVEAYRKIRNTARFLLGNINDYNGSDYSGSINELDKWAMSKLQGLVKRVTEAYERFEFHQVYHSIHNFCIVDMSSFYLDILKDRLYTFRSDSLERRAAQWVLHRILSVITKLMAPVLSFSAEEIWRYMPGQKEESVFLSGFPTVDERFCDPSLEERWEGLITMRDEVNRALEIKRQGHLIGNSLEAKVILYLPEELHRTYSTYTDLLPTLFIVSETEILPMENLPVDSMSLYESTELQGVTIDVQRAPGKKCERCWNWLTSVGTFRDAPELCHRCHAAVK